MSVIAPKYRSVSSEEAQKAGQQYYREKNYEAALEAFSAAIELSQFPASALDNRAATFEKLGDLRSALKDAKQMIQVEKTGVNGYLRAGKVLQRMEKAETALGVYKYGLKHVPGDAENYKLLKGMHDKLSGKLNPVAPKEVDPLKTLPLELTEQILRQLDFKTIVRCLRVSKQWNLFFESLPSLWAELDFSRARRPIRVTAIRACMRRSRGKVLCAKLNRVAVQDSDILTTLTTRCKELRHLEIVNGFSGSSILDAAPLAMNLESIVLSEAAEMSLDGANVLLQKCPNLQRAEFKNLISAGNRMAWPVKMENLRILRLESGSKKVSSVFLNLNALFEHAPNITELSIIGWLKDNLPLVAPDFGKLPHLTHLTLNPVPTAVFPRLPASLTSLSMSGCYSMDFFSHPMTQINLSSLRLENLTELRIHDGQYLPADVARTLLAHCRGDDKLRILGITRCLFINDTVIQQFLDEGVLVAEHLEELDLSDNASITDTTVEALAQHGVAALKKLNLSRTRVTGAGLKTLVTHPKANKLERLVLNGCTSMGIDAAEYIKTKGIAVEFRFPDNLKYGKRIRYG